MRAFAIFTGFLAICLLVSAMIHYPLHLALDGLIQVPVHKQVTRIGKLLALPGFFLLLMWLSLYSRQALGFTLQRSLFVRQMVIGWCYGTLILLALAISLISLGLRIPDPVDDQFWQDLAKAIVSGLIAGILVGIIEETFFRGAMFQAIRRQGSALSAIMLTSFLYAAVHFIKPLSFEGQVDWFSGLQILSGAFWQFGEWATFDSFIALFAVGVFLGLVRERTGNIAYCIGLHAGWVLIIKCTKKFTSNNHASDWAFLTGSYDGVTGYLAAAWILLLTLLYWHLSVAPSRKP
ncbi:hypothetical protein MNBD_GAMMA26-1113 [hydrothermal vent metagenome]|uniref:CAAX prenyl protease 2/Lysostaphin resistance protein A-like domain-containing protein n=1 Tax=hydrothermal vent metagenome TaxID=652676 RepID=A0A3B1B5U8_9ZZZZ